MAQNKEDAPIPAAIIDQYLELTAEKREQFRALLVDKDHDKWSQEKMSFVHYEIQGHKFGVSIVIRHFKPKKVKGQKKQPPFWFVQTVMPSTPKEVQSYLGDWKHRSKWDKHCRSFSEKDLVVDPNGDILSISNGLCKSYLEGAISPRQFRHVVESKIIDTNTVEIVSCSGAPAEYPKEKGYTLAETKLYGLRIEELDDTTLIEKYGIPKIVFRNEEGSDSLDVLKWSKCDCIKQSDLKGLLPKKIVEKGTAGATSETFQISRLYALR